MEIVNSSFFTGSSTTVHTTEQNTGSRNSNGGLDGEILYECHKRVAGDSLHSIFLSFFYLIWLLTFCFTNISSELHCQFGEITIFIKLLKVQEMPFVRVHYNPGQFID